MQALRVICLSGSLFYHNPAAVEADRLRTSEDDERELILSHTALAGSPSGSFVYHFLFYPMPAAVEADRLRTSEDGERKLILSHPALAGSPCESFVYQGTCFIKIRRRLREQASNIEKTVNGSSSLVTRR